MDVFDNVKLILIELMDSLTGFLVNLLHALAQLQLVTEVYTFAIRWLFPVLAIAIFLQCILPLLLNKKAKKVWGYLNMVNGTRIPIHNWENLIGRGKYADLIINLPFVSRSHAVLTFHHGTWSIADLGSKGGVEVNGKKIEGKQTINYGDKVSLAGAELVFTAPDTETTDSRAAEEKISVSVRSEEHTSELQSRPHLVC